MGYVTPEAIAQARQMDLLTYLQLFEPDELVRVNANTYCTKTHDSLKISNGMWHWFSRHCGGRNALEYLQTVKGYSFTQAVETITGAGVVSYVPQPAPKPRQQKNLLLPEKNLSTNRVRHYLRERGIHPDIIDYCIRNGMLYESIPHNNAVFIGRDKSGVPRYAFLRGTKGDFKQEATGSDKHYSFSIAENPGSGTVHLFESAIDLLSFATILHGCGKDWRAEPMLSLAGVFKTKRQNVVPVALSQFLQDHPEIRTIRLHLDNDEVGRGAAQGILGGLKGKYEVIDDPPPCGKDVNEFLQLRRRQVQRKEQSER